VTEPIPAGANDAPTPISATVVVPATDAVYAVCVAAVEHTAGSLCVPESDSIKNRTPA